MFTYRCLLFLMLIPGCFALGDLLVGFLSYTGHFNKDALGKCCSGSADGQECTQPCNLLFDVSVLDSEGRRIVEHQRPSGIPLRSYHDDVIFPMPFLSDEFINPIRFELNKLTPDLRLSVQVYDVDPESIVSLSSQASTFQLVDNMTVPLGLKTPSEFFNCRDVQGHIRSDTRLKLALRFSCHTLYTGDDCATDCLRSRRSLQCLNHEHNHIDRPAQTNWPFGSPLARCPAIPPKPSVLPTTILPSAASMPSQIIQATTTQFVPEPSSFVTNNAQQASPTQFVTEPSSFVTDNVEQINPTQLVTEPSSFVTDNVNMQKRTTTIVTSNDLTSSIHGTYTAITDAAKTSILTTPYMTHSITTDVVDTDVTTQLYGTQATSMSGVYTDMSSYLHVTQTVSTDAMSTDMTSGLHEPQTKTSNALMTDGTADISPTLTGTSYQPLNPKTTLATEIMPTSYLTINSHMATPMSVSNPDSQSTETALLDSITTTGVSKTSEINIASSFAAFGTGSHFTDINSKSKTTMLTSTYVASLTTLSVETSGKLKTTLSVVSPSGSTVLPSSSSSIVTAVTKSTDTNIPSATASVSGTTPNSGVTSQTSKSPNVVTSPKPGSSDRPETTNKIVLPTVLDDSTSSRDPMQFWAIIVGSVLGGLAVVGILGYVIYRSRQKALQKRQEIYTVTPQITSMIEENGTSGRSDVPMTTALL